MKDEYIEMIKKEVNWDFDNLIRNLFNHFSVDELEDFAIFCKDENNY